MASSKPPDVEIPLLGDAGNAAVRAGQRRRLDGKVTHERRRPQLVADRVLPQFFDQFAVPVAAVARDLDT